MRLATVVGAALSDSRAISLTAPTSDCGLLSVVVLLESALDTGARGSPTALAGADVSEL